MTTTTTQRFGAFAITCDTGVILTHEPTATSVCFMPGEDSEAFSARLEAMQDTNPQLTDEAILARLWEDYRP